jgi:adenylate cyclase
MRKHYRRANRVQENSTGTPAKIEENTIRDVTGSVAGGMAGCGAGSVADDRLAKPDATAPQAGRDAHAEHDETGPLRAEMARQPSDAAGPEPEPGKRLAPALDRIESILREWEDHGPASAEFAKRITQVRKSFSNVRETLAACPRSPDDAQRHRWAHEFRNKLVVLQVVTTKIPALMGSPSSHIQADMMESELAALDEDAGRWLRADNATDSPESRDRPAKPSPASAAGTPLPGTPLARAATPAQPRVAPTSTAPRLKVMLIDDESAIRGHFAEMIGEMGHDCIEAATAEEALRFLERREVDLILLDLHMGDVSGLEVLRHVNRDFGLRSIPIVVMSAEDRVELIAECIAEGADDFLVKPVHETIFRARVQSSLRKGQLRRNERRLHRQVVEAKQRADDLLYRVFPYAIAEELRTGGSAQPRGYDNVAVMFCDIIGFTEYCDRHPPREVVGHLDRLFTAYQRVADEHRVEKIKTIGDCVMLTAGLLRRFRNPVLSCLFAADAMRKAASELDGNWQVRIGIHAGPVVAGLVGNHYTFDVWGDTVNTAQRVEGVADAQGIAVSEPAWAQVYEWCVGRSMGMKRLKGKQELEVFRFEGFREDAIGQLEKLP